MGSQKNDADDYCPGARANGHHRWAQCFKDKISKTAYFQILRCRYCLQYLLAQFERTTLPSGRVSITNTVGIIPHKQMEELRIGYAKPVPAMATTKDRDKQYV